MSRIYFGTDGVRGPYGGPLINEAFAERLGFAVACWSRRRGTALIGRDTRASGPALEAAVARGLRAGGLEPVSLGVVPTPAVARSVVRAQAALGVVITASHNPARDNGIKFFGSGGLKLTDADEAAIEALLPDSAVVGAPVAAASEGSNRILTDAAAKEAGAATKAADAVSVSSAADYIKSCQALLPENALRGWRIVVDTANGATCETTPAVLRALGAEVIGIGAAPDGANINAAVGSEHPQRLVAEVRAAGARLGIAHDGDGDRCVLCDEHGEVLDGDELLTILAVQALRRGTLVKKTLVVTVQSNLGVDAAVTALGGRVCRTAVGDRYVIERMLAEGATLGGESSGHIICAELSPTGDGLVAALKAIEVMLTSSQPLSALRRMLRKFPQLSAALKVREKKPLETLPGVTSAVQALEAELGASGRVLVRYSGTEPRIRLLVEGPTEDVVRAGLGRIEAAVRTELDVL
ncbi:phosphoglucosamine mutase [Opitutus terrae]|uniref:Phosphoglucosamine mutase n=1 Tax=Opitutus terrae (strain DSM 11246 / JCM 15787 / PB90-1) TaxID=452637 RepID=B1ZWC1_OPITP|nr:phosphoglucosamine mutase [Opitutus terrae]ACB76873.1 phosphoglucosamine mutase [Opitutus terrae PB90-1]